MTPIETTVATRAAAEAAKWLPRPFRARRQVEAHNRQALRHFEDLTSWVNDDDHQLQIDLRTITNDLADRGGLRSGDYAYLRRERKRHYFERYRNEQRRIDRALEDLRAAEGAVHRLWRRHRPILSWPPNPRQREIEAILERWREPERGGNGEILTIDEPS